MAYEKLYKRINWLNRKESKTTPLGATNLNKIDEVVDKMDDRIVELDKNKVSKEDTIPIEKGGTGAKTAKEARYNLSNDMPQAEGIIADTDYFAGVYQKQSKDNGGVYKKKMPLIWDYIKSKISANAKAVEYDINGSITEITTAMSDTGQIIMKYTEPNSEKGVFIYRKATLLWDWIVSKCKNITAKGSLGWTNVTDGKVPVTLNTLAYWNGRYNDSSSNLEYCSKGAFGSMAIKNASDYTPVNNLLATTTGKPLDAVQGKALDERLSALEGEMELLGSVMVSSGGKSASKTLDIDVTQYRFLVLTLEQESPTQIITRTTYASTIAKAYTPCVMHCTYVNFSGTTISSVLKGKYNQSTGELLFESTNATAYQQARLYGIK